jgi:hypothetical protein
MSSTAPLAAAALTSAAAWRATRGRLASIAKRALRQASAGVNSFASVSVVASSAQPSSASRCANQAASAGSRTSLPLKWSVSSA